LSTTSQKYSFEKLETTATISNSKIETQLRSVDFLGVTSDFCETHFGYNIAQAIENQLRQLGVYEKTRTITCDGTSNVKKAFEQLDASIQRLQCLSHKFYLIVCN
ncbi:unnamed protein product, partial [Didymodactylos carnosus]